MYAVVTGASSGIGYEIARLLAKKGYDLILVARRKDRLEALKERILEMEDVHIAVYTADLSKPKECQKLFSDCRHYPVSILVNAAGFGKVGNFSQVPLKTELEMIQTNIVGLHILTKLFARYMDRGRILNVASIAAFQPGPMLSTYSATKSYVFNLSMAINYEMRRRRKNVLVSTLCPGPVDTEFDQVAGTHFSLPSISAKYCAQIAVDGLFKNKVLIVPGIQTKALRLLSRITPYKILLPIEYEIQTRKLKGDSAQRRQ